MSNHGTSQHWLRTVPATTGPLTQLNHLLLCWRFFYNLTWLCFNSSWNIIHRMTTKPAITMTVSTVRDNKRWRFETRHVTRQGDLLLPLPLLNRVSAISLTLISENKEDTWCFPTVYWILTIEVFPIRC